MDQRTFNTLFMLVSVDGKISTGTIEKRDFDKDLPKIYGAKKGLNQYYQLEQKTDLHSFNTGKVMTKIGMNKKIQNINKLPVSFIILDNKPHLTKLGINNLIRKTKKLYLITNNKNHPAFKIKEENMKIIYFKKIDFRKLFIKLKKKYKINKITIQSGGTVNSDLIREGLIDMVSLVISPVLIGGKDTPTIMDGYSIESEKELKFIKTLKLKKCEKLNNSYLHLLYEVN